MTYYTCSARTAKSCDVKILYIHLSPHIFIYFHTNVRRVVGMTLESPGIGKKATIHSEHSDNIAYFRCSICVKPAMLWYVLQPRGDGCFKVVVAVLLPRRGVVVVWGLWGLFRGSATPTTLPIPTSAFWPPVAPQLQQHSGFWSILSLWSALLWQMETQFSICIQARLKVLAIQLSSPWGLELLQRHRAASISVSHF